MSECYKRCLLYNTTPPKKACHVDSTCAQTAVSMTVVTLPGFIRRDCDGMREINNLLSGQATLNLAFLACRFFSSRLTKERTF